ncbi:mannose-1-phosphate guanylyltransferase/mannose-6-phosphate isomerase [Sphingosinicella microcystinivorans]|uniref:mannose-1-phosphate guanylyltransferase/mannose-6-phosphate isomerase n=1 Tax=Sphingosinicella microcystinivorans TaxID=335406 RepID=UPI0022F3B038|nr:mannose-1-phosphate guanylyltransferase/mannose-6-phosphate isomerase [Sphingosinicella microcystinivorans]WBX83076.1 mannose-1-phosphate guanylyltransferase/mannose-6-phosphate isomerase [Sphingosinicella microcystinivorans]
MQTTPVILSGGAGTRLWPLSRNASPKQLLRLLGPETLIQSAARRAPPENGFAAPLIVAGEAHLSGIEAQLAEIGVSPRAIVLEPAGRNTAPAVALAALLLAEDELMLVMPSDHIINDVEAFRAAIARAQPLAADGWLVTFGITPDRPETGYGYIESAEPLAEGVQRVARFVEKPPLETAKAYLETGRFCWNAGIFLLRAGSFLAELRRHAPEIEAAARRAIAAAAAEGHIIRPDSASFLASPSDSIDYAVMEKADRVAVVPVEMGWSDIGAFGALLEQLPRDDGGNAVGGDVLALDTANCLIRSEGPLIAAVGVSNVTIIATGDAVLVVANERAQDVKRIVDTLKANGRHNMS